MNGHRMAVSLTQKEFTFRDEYPLYEGPALTKYKQKSSKSPLFGTDPEEETEWR